MRQARDLDQSIAGRAAPLPSELAFQAQNMTVPRARRDADVKERRIGEHERLLATLMASRKSKN